MDGRRVVGSILVVAGLALIAFGAAGVLGGSPSPVSNGSPVPVATPPGSGSTVIPSGPPTAAPSVVSPTAPPVTESPVAAIEALIRAFFVKLEAAVRDGNQLSVSANLGGAVIDRYGVAACEAYLASRDPSPEQRFEIVSISGPAPWDYTTDGRTTSVADAYTVRSRVTGPNASGEIATRDAELHVSLGDGTVFWYTDCGEPLP